MTDNPRVEELLEEILDSDATPEEVCRDCPELLPDVRAGWQRLRALKAEVGALFPESTSLGGATPPVEPNSDLPQIAGYEVQEVLGRGGIGVVYKAWQVQLNRPVALKMLLVGRYARPEELERFFREAEAVARLRHANIVQVYDVGDLEGRPFFTMEYVEAGSLSQKLAGTPQPASQAAALVATVAEAIQVAHQNGIIHRDLKPANILVTAEGTPKITDFGLARRLDDGVALTLTGAPIGTPSYMAPEQALGQKDAIGPCSDVYALGAILYEMFTGRPPFRGETTAATVHQVLTDDPVPPSRLNPQTPRDLETICLKCLEKNPARRYASARDLADDLHRFLDGKPVVARPVGAVERIVKWVRRRPAAAMFVALLILALGLGIAAGAVLWNQANERTRQAELRRDRGRQAIELGIKQAHEAGRAERWKDVTRFIDSAATHLPEAESDESAQRLADVKRHAEFVQTLEYIRLHVTVLVYDQVSVPVTPYAEQAVEFEKAFAQSPFDLAAPVHETAERIRAFPFAVLVVAALDDWALAASITGRKELSERLLHLARLADPDPAWSDRLRSPDVWSDRNELLKLHDDAFRLPKVPGASQLAILGTLLRKTGDPRTELPMLGQACERNSPEFWLHVAQGNASIAQGASNLALAPYGIADALRPGEASIQARLAAVQVLSGGASRDVGIRTYRRALVQHPKNGPLRHGLVLALHLVQKDNEAEAECRKVLDADPQEPWAAFSLATILALSKDRVAAQVQLRQACQAMADGVSRQKSRGAELEKSGQIKEALAAYREAGELTQCSILGHHVLAKTLAALDRHEEAIKELQWVLRTLDENPLYRGDGMGERKVAVQMALIESLSALERYAEASAVAQQALQTVSLSPLHRMTIEGSLRNTDKLAALRADYAAYISGAKKPPDRQTHVDLAKWLLRDKQLTAAAARCYEGAFAWPGFEFELHHRYQAACAAALAGSGIGRDADKLTDDEKSAFRKLARKWLSEECRDVNNQLGKPSALGRAMHIMTWNRDPDLACVRDQARLDDLQLSDEERKEWADLWKQIRALSMAASDEVYRKSKIGTPYLTTPKDLARAVDEARSHADKQLWKQASVLYGKLVKEKRVKHPGLDSSEIWFEFAAVQLLADDPEGYRATCKFMLDAAKAKSLRAFLAARACTLTSDPEIDVGLAVEVSVSELKTSPNAFWSLTQQGALKCRMKQYKEAVPLLTKSMGADKRPGSAVLNWLWLAQANHHLGHDKEAQDRLKTAQTWLDSLGKEYRPSHESSYNLHRHNWLEAQVLRHEVEALLAPKKN